jgi:hypothetical protein
VRTGILRCAFRFRNPVLALVFVCRLLAQNQTPAAEPPPHRFEYSAEHFTIELPGQWTELDQATAGQLGSAVAVLMPNAPKLKFNHLYTSPDAVGHLVFVMLTSNHFSDAYFKDLVGANRAASDAAKSFLSGSIFQGLQSEYTSYDTERHVLWVASKGNSVLTGEVLALAGMYITKVGTIGVGCYAKAAEFENFQAECRQIIRSVKIDPDVAPTPPVPLSKLLRMTTDQANTTYRQLVERVNAGDFSVDFRELRMACARSNICEVRATPHELAEMARANKEQRQSDVVEICQRLISRGFINVEAHLDCSLAYAALDRPDRAKFHMNVMTALFQSILTSGDGNTEETAYEVISVREVYEVLASKRLPQFGEGVLLARSYSAGGHDYARWEVRDPKTQAKVVIFFKTNAVPSAYLPLEMRGAGGKAL